jgi:hypothetical protein
VIIDVPEADAWSVVDATVASLLDAFVLGVGAGRDDVKSRARSSHRSDAGGRVVDDVASGRIRVRSCGRGRGSGRRLPESSSSGECHTFVLRIGARNY